LRRDKELRRAAGEEAGDDAGDDGETNEQPN
jgi:hypothetical protein